MIRNITFRERLSLDFAIENALKSATQEVFLITTNNLQEPDYVAALASRFTGKLYNILNGFFRGYSFSTAGIFCHQKPFAKMKGESKSCEIGDLLFIYIYHDRRGKKYYNSLLFQAKKSKTEFLALSDEGDLRQFRLYSEWPEFEYTRSGVLNGTRRDVVPKAFTAGAKYLLIDSDQGIYHRKYPFEYIYGTALACNPHPLIIDNKLSMELIDFINFKAGRIVEERPTNDEWSKLIWDLYNTTKGSLSKRKNAGLDEFDRITSAGSDIFCTTNINPRSGLSLINDIGNNNGDDSISETYSDDKPEGISMIIIEGQGFVG